MDRLNNDESREYFRWLVRGAYTSEHNSTDLSARHYTFKELFNRNFISQTPEEDKPIVDKAMKLREEYTSRWQEKPYSIEDATTTGHPSMLETIFAAAEMTNIEFWDVMRNINLEDVTDTNCDYESCVENAQDFYFNGKYGLKFDKMTRRI